MVLSDAADIIGGKKEAPTLVHLVAMSVNKENGDLEGNLDKDCELSGAHKMIKMMMAMIRVVTRDMVFAGVQDLSLWLLMIFSMTDDWSQ